MGPEMVQTESLGIGPTSASRLLHGTRAALTSQLGEQAPGSDQLCVIPASIMSQLHKLGLAAKILSALIPSSLKWI